MFPLKIKVEPGIENDKETKMNEVTDLLMEIEKARTNYFQNSLLLKAIKQVTCENNSELLQIAPKVQQIITSENISNFNLGEKNQTGMNILGLTGCKNYSYNTLTYSEKTKFNSFVERRLLSNCSEFNNLQWTKENTLQKRENSKYAFPSEKIELLRSTNRQFLKMYENLSLYKSLTKDLMKMRQELLEMVKSTKIPWFEVRCEFLELEAKILEQKTLVHMFSENSNIVEAAKRICDASQNEYEDRKFELEKLRRDEAAYNRLDGTKYDDLLRKYKKYTEDLEAIHWMALQLS
ncbi:hypothetical protein L9F63_017588 [Diploptera punctata]|uniref:Uncharacterized protein n=1 Tax=Diploptera punctata TaxID=6984 RepID=A0AAD7ZYE9_DIPPU|nr:hypothetical protein L9F63_017588 [Diploptera punctata]